MPLPKKITPSPLIVSTVELRFESEFISDNFLSKVFPIFSSELPKLTPNQIPVELKSNPDYKDQLEFFPDFTLGNDHYSVGLGKNVINFENAGDYNLWENYFPFIQKQLLTFYSLGIISKINRVGARYGSVFQNCELKNILRFDPVIPIEGYVGDFNMSQTNYKQGDYNILMQLYKAAKIDKGGKKFLGAYIDLDCSFTGNLEPGEHVFKIIDDLHNLQKSMFFEKLLAEDFLNTLNPEY